MKRLTSKQLALLKMLEYQSVARTAKELHVRSDALWALEERGLVSRNAHNEWSLTTQGYGVLDARF